MKDQVFSVTQQVVNIGIAAAGMSAAALAAPCPIAMMEALTVTWIAIKANTCVVNAIASYEFQNRDKPGFRKIVDLEKGQNVEDYVRLAATISSILDPTGLTSGLSCIVAAFTYPTCDKIVTV